jgi:hypothetical protein
MSDGYEKRSWLLKLGEKLYEAVAAERVVLSSRTGAKDFQTELERVTALIGYVRNKLENFRAQAQEENPVSRKDMPE